MSKPPTGHQRVPDLIDFKSSAGEPPRSGRAVLAAKTAAPQTKPKALAPVKA